MIGNDIQGIPRHLTPFTVGDLDPKRTFVHVLDDTALEIVMGTVDTISDFLGYLKKKESFLRSGRRIFAAGEEELLAWYLKHTNHNREHDFVFPPAVTGSITLLEGGWAEFVSNPHRLAQIEHDRVSYFWDRMVEEFNKHALAGTQYWPHQGDLSESERAFRFFARECRTRRRMLSAAWREMLLKTSSSQDRRRFMTPSAAGDPYYILALVARPKDLSYEKYREYRRSYLETCARVLKVVFPDALDIVGIAMDSGLDISARSEDAIFFDARDWTPADEEDARALQKRFGIFLERRFSYESVAEYPDLKNQRRTNTLPPNPRNKPCPCGSGAKFKKCHGA